MMELIRGMRLHSIGAAPLAALQRKCDQKLAARGFVSLADQAVVSGTSFLTTLVIGRACLPEELGLYSLGFSLVLLLMDIPRSLIWTPFTAFAPRMRPADQRLYGGSTLMQQVALCGIATVLISSVGLALGSLGSMHRIALLLTVLGPATALLFFREYIRRICFAQLEVVQVLAIDVVIAALQSAGLLLLAYYGRLTAISAFLVIVAASIPVAAAWIMSARQNLAFSRDSFRADAAKNWTFARWLLAGAVVGNATVALEPWLLSASHGIAAAGIVIAAQGIISLLNPLSLSFTNFFWPYAAHVYAASGAQAVWRLVAQTTLAMTVVVSAFAAVGFLWGGELLALMFGAEYAGQGHVVAALVLGECCLILRLPVAHGLAAAARGDALLKASVIRLAITGTFGVWCIIQFGAAGVGYSQIVSNLAANAWQWLILRLHALETSEARS